ncbi:serine/threonine-protein kinase [Streptomyces sp. 4N509B]|uniref:serine/threonine-protein kinase n=1 Tax=Streptomyces sp. 4N509B TaxID=3457413 RepID=UPI003FD63745
MHQGMAVGDRYRVERVLGRGGLGEVWEAEDRTLGRRVAVKFVTGVTEYPEAAERFAREARTLASLRHGGIVTVHDAGTVDHDGRPLPYLVMELLDGVTWEFAHVDSVEETGACLADVLAHVHAARIVHRDVKPANVMICADGRTVLMDFGIARDDASLTRNATTTGRFLGTPAYMAPEQLQGRAATPASDVYALGVVLVEKLTGHRLPAAQLLPEVRSSLREPLLSLLTRMTSAHPEQRPTAAECAALLRAPARPTATRRATPTATRRATPTATRRVTPTARGREWRRLAPPAVLLLLYAITLFLPGYRADGLTESVIRSFGRPIANVLQRDDVTPDRVWGALTSLGTAVGVATVLVALATLVPGSRPGARLTGYGGAVLAVLCLGWQATANPPYYITQDWTPTHGTWLFHLVTALATATYVHRDVRTRRQGARP